MKTILFQGDSITDADRCREDDNYMGAGYAVMTAGMVGIHYAGQYHCLNRGISGNRSCDLYARIKADIINLKPDILTVLIGVNDTWHQLKRQDGVSVERYETLLDLLICDVKAALPNIRIVLLEPFVMLGPGTEGFYEAFARDVAERQTVCRQLAEKHALILVPLQDMLERFEAEHPGTKVLIDGVHPNYIGHKLMADALFKALQPIL
ncbi:MAG: SGNH/GDSL hydrolase family protein [Oscillospiraceae bacterium]|nr:SGNH/GDSL hydrolase family protein [Oscillospiraceae bacterium]